MLIWASRQSVARAETAVAQLQFIHPELVAERQQVGVSLFLGEGQRIVVRGVILSG